jgi:hypothetical protein
MRGKQGYYYPMTTKRMLVTVMNMLSGIIVYSYDKNGKIVDEVNVELMTGPAQTKHRARTNEEQQQYVPKFPRIEVHYEGMNLDETRLISPNTERFWNESNVNYSIEDHKGQILLDLNGLIKDFNPVPYNYVFTINVFTEYIDHMAQILENIFPYFTPSNTTLRVKEFEFLNIERDIKVTLGNPALSFESTEIAAGDTRKISSNFSLTLEGFMYRKVENVKIVATAVVDLFATENFEDNTDESLGSIETPPPVGP